MANIKIGPGGMIVPTTASAPWGPSQACGSYMVIGTSFASYSGVNTQPMDEPETREQIIQRCTGRSIGLKTAHLKQFQERVRKGILRRKKSVLVHGDRIMYCYSDAEKPTGYIYHKGMGVFDIDPITVKGPLVNNLRYIENNTFATLCTLLGLFENEKIEKETIKRVLDKKTEEMIQKSK